MLLLFKLLLFNLESYKVIRSDEVLVGLGVELGSIL